jgi:hypothetical protein
MQVAGSASAGVTKLIITESAVVDNRAAVHRARVGEMVAMLDVPFWRRVLIFLFLSGYMTEESGLTQAWRSRNRAKSEKVRKPRCLRSVNFES